MSKPPGRGSEERFSLGKYWLAQERPGGNWYRCWYVSGTRTVRRRSLGTPDFEEAKVLLAAFVLGSAPDEPKDPENVMVNTVLNHYWTHYSDDRKNPRNARRPGELLMEFLDDNTAKVAELTKIKQQAFMRWLSKKYDFKTPSISRHLSIINSALSFAAKPQIINQDGEEVEVVVLKYKPTIFYNDAEVAEVTGQAPTEPRTWIPSHDELAAFLDAIEQEHLFRYCIIALNTWARPEAIMELSVSAQVDKDDGLVALNPPGRRQTKKYRPTIRLTDNLRGWLEHWKADQPILWKKEPVANVKKAFARAAERAELPQMTRYSLRKYMATKIRRAGVYVPPEQRDIWLGHNRTGSGTAQRWYELNDPEYLRECSQGTDLILENLHFLANRSLFAPKLLPKRRSSRLRKIA